MKKVWIAIAAIAVIAGIALLFSEGEPPANPADQPGEVSISEDFKKWTDMVHLGTYQMAMTSPYYPDDRIGSGIR